MSQVSESAAARRRRLLPRFSLRTLLVAVLTIGSGFGLWYRWEPWVWYANLMVLTDYEAAEPAASERLQALKDEIEQGREDLQFVCASEDERLVAVSKSYGEAVYVLERGAEKPLCIIKERTFGSTGGTKAHFIDEDRALVWIFQPFVGTVASSTAIVTIWEIPSGRLLSRLQRPPLFEFSDWYVSYYSASKQAQKLVLAASDDWGVWDGQTGKILGFEADTTSVIDWVGITNDGKWVMAGGNSWFVLHGSSPWRKVDALHEDPPDWKTFRFSHPGVRLVESTTHEGLPLYRLRRPEAWWGVAWLPEFWLTFTFLIALAWSLWRDFRTLRKPA